MVLSIYRSRDAATRPRVGHSDAPLGASRCAWREVGVQRDRFRGESALEEPTVSLPTVTRSRPAAPDPTAGPPTATYARAARPDTHARPATADTHARPAAADTHAPPDNYVPANYPPANHG